MGRRQPTRMTKGHAQIGAIAPERIVFSSFELVQRSAQPYDARSRPAFMGEQKLRADGWSSRAKTVSEKFDEMRVAADLTLHARSGFERLQGNVAHQRIKERQTAVADHTTAIAVMQLYRAVRRPTLGESYRLMFGIGACHAMAMRARIYRREQKRRDQQGRQNAY